ncbi:MAG: formylglycine-generating enzyme family protein [Lewinellaceae bacterium]|nr:formylglycine-generating enzyme family protein [Lewinellaceae bacterium]
MNADRRENFTQPLPNGAAFEMIFVEGGAFLMGSEEERAFSWEKPAHRVELKPFWIGQHPVTQSLWEAVMGAGSNPSNFKGNNRPVERVSWYDAAVFCNALNEQCGYEPCYFSDEAFQKPYGKTASGYTLPNEGPVHQKSHIKNRTSQISPAHRQPNKPPVHQTSQIPNQKSKILPGYRLPTEAEWEYAARGGPSPEGRPRYAYAGGDKLDEVGWYDDNSHRETKPVGLKLPNELGLCDMSGNVWEWCEDQWRDNYKGAPGDGSAWVDKEQGAYRVSRGGGWNFSAGGCRCAYRSSWLPRSRSYDLGFRLVWVSPSVHPVK